MGLKDRFNESLAQSRSMLIELDQDCQITNSVVTPGTRVAGRVVIRNPKPLSVTHIRITIYGVSNSHIVRKAGRSIQLQYFGRGFLFQEIAVLHSGQTTLEPSPAAGHAYPFAFTVPETTAPMAQNEANVVNRWKPEPPFFGAREMHALPPSFSCFKKSVFGSQEARVSYHLDATCVKGAKGSSFSLPEAASSFSFSPRRVERPSDLRMQIAEHGPLALHIPSAAVPGCPIPLLAGRSQTASSGDPLLLTRLKMQIKSATMIRGRTFGFGGKTAQVNQDWVVASLNDLAISLGAQQPTNVAECGIRLALPQDAKPTFRSYTVCLGYEVRVEYSFRHGSSQAVSGAIPWTAFEVLPAFC